MKKIILLVFVIPVFFINYSCEDNSTNPDDRDSSISIARKPNIYIYPEQTLNLFVKLVFPNGGEILEAIPNYQNSWDIIVEPNGKINKTYDYLFYECRIPNLFQKENGWIIKKENLNEFFTNNLSKSGFSQKEINDFVDYWIPILNNYKYYEIYPQYKTTLDTLIKIHFSDEPKNFYRLFYLIIGRNNNDLRLTEPKIESATRDKYFAVEWGVILNL